jgi:hypothetical protein
VLQCRAIELWRPVVGFEDVFQVSNCGGVRAADRPVYPHTTPQGYRRVYLDGTRRTVHSLVLEAFVCPRPPGMLGLHRDDVKWHNHASNLYWGSAADNGRDAVRNGVWRSGMAGRTHCPREHELVESNLVVAQLPYRICKACNRARAQLVFRHGKDWTEDDMRAESDARYAEILATGGVALKRGRRFFKP